VPRRSWGDPLTSKELGWRMMRARGHISIFEMARAIDHSASLLRMYERGDRYPSIPVLDRFARTCRLTLSEIFR
jgi:hypothetical protein